MQKKSAEELIAENEELRAQLNEAQDTLDAIRRGEVDGVVVSTPKGEQVYSISGAEKPYRILIEQMKEGAVTLSDDNTILYCNSGFAKMLNYPIEKIVGSNIENFVSPTHIEALTDLLSTAKKYESSVTKEISLQSKDDVFIPTLISVNCPQSDTLKNTFLVVTDLSQHMEQEVKRYTAGLELEIAQRKKAEEALKQRTKQLESTQKKLEENAILLEEYSSQMEELAEKRANQLKDSERLAAIGATAGMVGHDIRNPLQAILGDLYLAREEMKQMPQSQGKNTMQESLDEIEENINYINKIVSDLQDFTRALNPVFEKVCVNDIISNVLATVGVPNKIQTQVTAQKVVIDTDPVFLRRILTNLITNALQAMSNGGKLTVEAQQKDDSAIICVKDTGDGIPDKIKPNLFTPLFTTKAKGQGLGLAVIKRMVDSMNGSITVESQVGCGATFTIKLPTRREN